MCGRLPAPVSVHSCGHVLPAALTSACVLYLLHWKLCSLHDVYVENILWVWLVGYKALVALPRAAVRPCRHHQGHLACALGRGCG